MKTNFKILLVLTIISGILVGCNIVRKGSDYRNRRDPIIERANVVTAPGLIPSAVRSANGDLVVCWDTEGGDGNPGQKTQFARSSDLGKTWSKPYMTINDRPLTGIHSTLNNLPDRNSAKGLIMLYTLEVIWEDDPTKSRQLLFSLVNSRKFDSYYSFSADNGKTFTERKLLSDPVKRNDFSQGDIVELPNGDLIWPWGNWGSDPLNGFKRSTDGGLNWGPVVRAWQDPPPGLNKPLAYNETAAVVGKDGTIVAVARVDGAPGNDKRFWQIKSTDNGKTWSTPRQIEIAGGSPAMYCTPKGQLWMAYRDGGFGPGLGLAVSDDNGDTWRFLFHLKDAKGEHEKLYGHIRYTEDGKKKAWRPGEGIAGYPRFVKLSDTEVYVVFHAQNREELGKLFPATPFYIAGNLLRIPK